MKAIIKVVTAEKEFTQEQTAIIKRIALVLIEHNLSVELSYKVKQIQPVPLKFKLKVIRKLQNQLFQTEKLMSGH
jgi:hypothetical protein